MGRELPCTVRSGGKAGTGKALLETNELIFRGEPRLKIPLALLQSVSSREGELHLKWPDGTAIFELGEHAATWAHKILHPKTLMEKLGIETGQTISTVVISDAAFLNDLRTYAKSFSDTKPLNASDLIVIGAEKRADLARVAKLVPKLARAGAMWIFYPKGRKEIREQEVLDAGRRAGLVDVKVVSFSSTHTALKFVRPKASR